MVSDKGASVMPAWSALYPQTSCREDRWGDQHRTQGDLLEEDLRDPGAEQLGGEQRRVEQRRLPLALAPDEPVHQTAIAATPIASSSATDSPPSCHTRTPTTRPPIPTTERTAPTTSTDRSPVYGTSRMPRLPSSTAAMMSASIRKPTRHDSRVVTKPPIRPDRSGDRPRSTDQREDLRARLPRSCRGSTTASPGDRATRRAHREPPRRR